MTPEDAAALRIPLNNRRKLRYALVDAADAPKLVEFNRRWYFDGMYAAALLEDRTRVRLHRFLLDLPAGGDLEVDHINCDKLDNRRANLRLVSHFENCQNRHDARGTSRHRGVSWAARRGMWVAQAKVKQEHHFLGYFDLEDEDKAAAAVRDFWAERGVTL